MIFAKAGEQILNDDGSLYATFARDFDDTEALSPSVLRFEGDTPALGAVMPTCVVRWMNARAGNLPMFKSVRAIA